MGISLAFDLSSQHIALSAALFFTLVSLYVAMGWFNKKVSFSGCHVLITGGSTGIGLALAQEFILLGASVTIIARTRSKLDKAVSGLEELIQHKGRPGRVQAIAADVTNSQQVISAVEDAEGALGPIDVAVSCAGAAFPGRFLDQDLQLFEKSMQLDYFGSLYLAKAVLPGMVRRGTGRLLFVASPLAAIGFVGYSTYAPAKWAVRGLADVLRNELAGTGVKLSIGYPLDTDTPGFANENLTKPPETETITRFAGGDVFSAEKVASGMIKGLQQGQYHIKTPDLVVNLLISSMASTTPRSYPLMLEACWSPVVVIVLSIYRQILDSIVIRQRKKEETAAHNSQQ